MDQRALAVLAEELAAIAEAGGPDAAARMGARIREEAPRHHLAPWTLTHMVGNEWVRLGIAPGERLLAMMHP